MENSYENDTVVDEIIEYSKSGDYQALQSTMSNQTAQMLMSTIPDVLSNISVDVMDKVKDMYVASITKQIQLDIEELGTKESVIKQYNELISAELNKLDTTNTEQTQNTIDIIAALRESLDMQLKSVTKNKSVFKRLFGKN